MSAESPEERLARRIADMYANDQQFAAARPIEASLRGDHQSRDCACRRSSRP